jgi:hypothetical protein
VPVHLIRTDGLVGAYQPVHRKATGEELLAENMDMFFRRSESFAQCRFWWADFTGGDVSEVSTVDIHALQEIAVKASEINSKLALVIVAPDDLTFGLARMFNLFVDATGWELGSFRTVEDGFAWLQATLGREITPDPGGWERLDPPPGSGR